MEVIVTIVSKLAYNLFRGLKQPTCIGVKESIDPKYQQDIPVATVQSGAMDVDFF